MNPMNFGGGFGQFTDERVNPTRANWTPLTPEKQFPRSNAVNPSPAEWQQLSGMYGSYIQENSNFSGGAQNFMNSVEGGQNVGYYGCNGDLGDRNKVLNNIAGSYAQAFNEERATQSNNIPVSYAQGFNVERATQSNDIPRSYAQAFNVERATQSNNISGSYAQAFNIERASQNNNIANLAAMRNAAAFMTRAKNTQRGPTMVNAPPIPDLYSQVDSTRRIPNAGTSALADLNHWSSSNQLGTCNSLSDIQHGFHVPGRPDYNLNLPPRTEIEVSTRIGNSAQIPAVEQNEGNKFQNSQLSAVFNLLIGESSSKGKDHEIVPATENEESSHHCNELQNIVDSSSSVISTPFKENKDSEKVSDQDIDLNRTPQLKAPKRRKIRPKVVVEGKPKRVPKSAGHNMDSTSKESPVAKRKYVRKNGLKEPGSQQGDIINSPTPPTPINADSNQKTGKRKYVRKKGVTESTVQKADTVGNDTDPNAGTAANSCRRGLIFDLEESSNRDQSTTSGGKEAQQIMRPFNLNLDAQNTELYSGTNSSFGARSTKQISQQDGKTGTSSATPSMDNILTNYISLSERRAAGAPQASMDSLRVENANVCSRDIDVGNAGPWQRRSTCGFTPRQQKIYAEGIGQIVFQAKTNENIEATRQLMSQSRPQQVLESFSHSIESRGSKRGYQHMLQQGECYRMSSNSSPELSDNHKKKMFENGLLMSNYGMPFAKVVEDISTEANTGCINEVRANCFTSQIPHEILNSRFRNCNSPKEPTCVAYFLGDFHTHHVASRHSLPHQPTPEKHSYKDTMGETRGVTQVQHLPSQSAIANHNRLPPAPSKIAYVPEKKQANRTYQVTAPAKKQTAVRASSNSAITLQDRGLQEQKSVLMKHLSRQSQGLTKQQQHHIQIDKIIHQLECLSIQEAGYAVMRRDQQAIVPYKGDGAIVLHDVKRRKPRPKVDLDPETNRIWKLLMGNEGGEGIEGADKEKWWEGEREVFRGRADSFIARMHLVQGDRRFSPWKGSVVDSIIGVFLTQNVSDHLSSSAFMCLAARFPPNTANNDASESNVKSKGKSILIEEPEDCVVNLEESIKSLEKISCLPVDNGSSVTPQKLREQKRESETSGTERTSFTEVQSQNVEEEVISSQGSNDSSIVQDSGGIRFYSGFNSEAEDPRNGCIYQTNPSSNSINFQEVEKTAIFQECCSHVDESCPKKQSEHPESCMPRSKLQMGALNGSAFTNPITSQDLQMRVPAAPSNNCLSSIIPDFGVQEYLDMFSEESTSQWYSTTGIVRTKYANCANNLAPKYVTESHIQRNALLRSQDMATARPFELSSVHSMQQQSISQRAPHAEYDQQFHNNYPSGRNMSLLFENTSVAESVNHADALANWNNGTMKTVQNVSKQMDNNSDFVESISVMNNQACNDNTPVKPKPKEQVHSSGKPIVEMNTKAKSGKAGNEGKNGVDWDILRKRVQANGRKERSKDAMDTMDYEAMRSAKIKEISDAIKERGMNNMLAERIQDFLNRLVREHGSIDLEWLREVPPDKAKEYLLSIRGLGLKSVECVRLLTLHQLAFPVDTNVGRIAVRLGWVPLQPLPESLQLHLLEMYPMLESIQKYIWPRLCKLDQRTLYELHYQMITFGKVFCTKSKPNCNACPMKGECRHFASAFASARLALPSPEEKGIVSSTFPTSQERNPTAVINPMPLLREPGSDGTCNPIIEEPATPEQEITELLESDIEDMFDEDPDEIPTIKLNIETFTENLQKYMQENMELQEGDMSRALVALNPEAAAIPTPKLKNVSRLRTEHQVYELPDSHPLLTGMDRREPDDPSPYLLAIWTPGETADSIRPPDIKCSFQDTGKLCNEETCFSCNSTRESNSQIVRGTILIPCRTAMRGSFPLNGTYFQVNEMFADHKSSVNPIDVPRSWIWNFPRRTVYFGTSVSTIFKGLSTEGIQYCFLRGFVCVRGFDQETRAPRPLMSRLHCPASKLAKQ